MHYPASLQKVMEFLKKLPGVGNKSAERYAFQLLAWDKTELKELAHCFHTLHEKLSLCSECGSLTEAGQCRFCTDERKAAKMMCVIGSPKDLFAIERTREYRGLYHVLGGLLSPMDGLGPDKLTLPQLARRIRAYGIEELIIAVDSTLEGDATALFLKQELEPFQLNITRLAFGIPMGSSLEYVDGGTLARALMGRDKI
jgi:recombination protein RecR